MNLQSGSPTNQECTYINPHLKLSGMRKELPTINAYSIPEHANDSSRLLHSSTSFYQQTKQKIVERRVRLLFVMNATRIKKLRTIRSFHEDNARVVQDIVGDDCNYTANETARNIGHMKFILWCDYSAI